MYVKLQSMCTAVIKDTLTAMYQGTREEKSQMITDGWMMKKEKMVERGTEGSLCRSAIGYSRCSTGLH